MARTGCKTLVPDLKRNKFDRVLLETFLFTGKYIEKYGDNILRGHLAIAMYSLDIATLACYGCGMFETGEVDRPPFVDDDAENYATYTIVGCHQHEEYPTPMYKKVAAGIINSSRPDLGGGQREAALINKSVELYKKWYAGTGFPFKELIEYCVGFGFICDNGDYEIIDNETVRDTVAYYSVQDGPFRLFSWRIEYMLFYWERDGKKKKRTHQWMMSEEMFEHERKTVDADEQA